MTDDTPARPIAGWYPDPDEPETHKRYWDGYAWQLRKPLNPEVPVSYGPMSDPQFVPKWLPVPVGPGWQDLGTAVRVILRILLVVTLAQAVLYAWGSSMIEDAALAGDVDRLDLYDSIDLGVGLASLVLLLVAGVTWMVWQYQLAKSTLPSEIRRGPGWHAFSWIVPVVGLWFPYQNVKDLWRRRFPERGTAVLGWWWAGWVVTNVLDRVYIRRVDDADSPEEIVDVVQLELVSALVSLVTLVLAIRIHRALSDAERVAPPRPEAMPAG